MSKIDNLKERVREIKKESDVLSNLIAQINNSVNIDEVCNNFEIHFDSMSKIIKTEIITPQTQLSEEIKLRLIRFLKHEYELYFSDFVLVKHANKKPIKTGTLRNYTIRKNELNIAKLEKGFNGNEIGLFESMRLTKIKELKEEIIFLKKMIQQSKKEKQDSKSDFKKPMARIIYTPMGGKV